MAESMVRQFQVMALDNEVPIMSLLRMAKAIAFKLELQNVSEWIDHELNGYNDTKVPEYRVIKGQLKAVHPMHGLVEAPVADSKLESKLATVYIKSSISELASIPPGSNLSYPLSTQLSHSLQSSQPDFLRFSLVRIVGHNKLVNISEQVRNRLLYWSLELEQEGILGEGLQFSQQDKNRASMTTNNFNFNGTVNNAGVLGSDNHDFKQQNSQQITVGDFDALKSRLESFGFSKEDVQELKRILDSEQASAGTGSRMQKVYTWLGKAGGRVLDAGIDKMAPLAIEAISQYLGS
ncbi:AbiTii domain-containing protein [Klebsiella michiganensis]|uniref:AbiTii domain-containing protein n=1 Tax=Klebsiella michiganensis TaxID=1134687 RepID=UPI003885DCB5